MSHHKKTEHHVRPYKILAQTVGLLVSGYFIFLLLGQTLPGVVPSRAYEAKTILPLVLIPVAGYALTYFKELYGTLIVAIGAIILFVYFSIAGDYKMAIMFSVPFLIVSGLFFLHMNKRSQLQLHN